MDLLGLKIIDWITDAKNAKKELEKKCVDQNKGMLKQIINTWRIMIKALGHHI